MQCWTYNNIEQSTKAERGQQDYELLLLSSCSCSSTYVHTTQKWLPQELLAHQGSTEKTVNIFETHRVSKWTGLRIRNTFSPNANILPSVFHGLCHWSKNSQQTITSCPRDSTDRHHVSRHDTVLSSTCPSISFPFSSSENQPTCRNAIPKRVVQRLGQYQGDHTKKFWWVKQAQVPLLGALLEQS